MQEDAHCQQGAQDVQSPVVDVRVLREVERVELGEGAVGGWGGALHLDIGDYYIIQQAIIVKLYILLIES